MISVVLATYNEEKQLRRTLASLVDIADEIIIVDGSSSDATVDIAKSFGARIISTTNKPNFHINKQMAIDAAQGDLILQLDADEVVDDELVQFVQHIHTEVLSKNQTTADAERKPVAWWIKRKNFFLGKFLTKGGQYPDPVIRLFLKGKASLPQKDVHEQMKVDGEVGWADGHLLHYSNPTFSDYLRKSNTYTSFSAGQLLEEKLPLNFVVIMQFFFVKPIATFFSLFLRHKGLVDGVPGFVFALMSALHHPVSLIKYWELLESDR